MTTDTETPDRETLLAEFQAIHGEAREMLRRGDARMKDAEAVADRLVALGSADPAPRRRRIPDVPGPVAHTVREALKSAATGYAYALDAVRDDVAANIAALSDGKLRQISSNSTASLTRFGELTVALELARELLPAGDIRDILEDAAASIDDIESR